jgi:hypothetical protein
MNILNSVKEIFKTKDIDTKVNEEIIEEKIQITKTINEGISDKITNPFIFTFIIAWIIHNWDLVYGFFFFDSNFTLQKKLSFFHQYWLNHNFWTNSFYTIIWTFIVLILVSFLKLGAKKISIIYNNILLKMIKSEIISEKKYNLLLITLQEKKKEIFELKQNEIELESKIKQVTSLKSNYELQINSLKRNIESISESKQSEIYNLTKEKIISNKLQELYRLKDSKIDLNYSINRIKNEVENNLTLIEKQNIIENIGFELNNINYKNIDIYILLLIIQNNSIELYFLNHPIFNLTLQTLLEQKILFEKKYNNANQNFQFIDNKTKYKSILILLHLYKKHTPI